jgi:hypothetical protein
MHPPGRCFVIVEVRGRGGGVSVSLNGGWAFGIAGLCVGAWVMPLTEVPEGQAGRVSAGGGPG